MNRLIELVQRNGVILLIAVFLSWLIWYQVRLELTDELIVTAEYTIVHPGDVRVRGERRGVIEGVRISGTREEIARIDVSRRINLKFTIDSADPREIEQRVRFTAKQAERTSGKFTVEQIEPFEVVFSVIDSKLVPVFADVNDEDLKSNEQLDFDASDRLEAIDRVKIEGPKAALALIEELTAGVIYAKDHRSETGSGPVTFAVPIDPIEGIRIEGSARFKLLWIIEDKQATQVPLEVHWVFPAGAEPAEVTKNWVSLDEDLDANVTVTADGFVLEVIVIGDRLDVPALQKSIRAYVRPDEQTEGSSYFPIHFANVPDGVRIELKDQTNRGKIGVKPEKR